MELHNNRVGDFCKRIKSQQEETAQWNNEKWGKSAPVLLRKSNFTADWDLFSRIWLLRFDSFAKISNSVIMKFHLDDIHWFRLDPPKVKIWQKKSRKQTVCPGARCDVLKLVTQALHFDTFWLKFMIILAELGFESLIHSPENITNKTKIKYSALIAKKLDLWIFLK